MGGGFLRRFLNILAGLFTEHSGQRGSRAEPLLPGLITRVVFDKDNFNQKGAKPRAFLPNPNNLETSVALIRGLTEEETWELAETEIAKPRGRKLKARADVASDVIYAEGLSIDHNKKPFMRHANIVGWPTEKDAQKDLAIELASNARLLKPPKNRPLIRRREQTPEE